MASSYKVASRGFHYYCTAAWTDIDEGVFNNDVIVIVNKLVKIIKWSIFKKNVLIFFNLPNKLRLFSQICLNDGGSPCKRLTLLVLLLELFLRKDTNYFKFDF